MSAFNTELLVKLGLELCHSCVLPCVAYKPLLASMGFCLENKTPQKRGVDYIKISNVVAMWTSQETNPFVSYG